MRRVYNIVKFTFLYFGLFLFSTVAFAFIDPSAVTCVIQAVAGTVIPGETDSLFKSKDKNAAYNALVEILSITSSEREHMGRQGRKYVEENFNRESVVRIYREVVESV